MKISEFHLNIKIRLLETFLSTLLGSMIFPFMAIYMSKNFGVKISGLLLLMNVFIGVIVKFFGGYLSDHFGRKKVVMYAEVIRLLAFVTMLICNSPWYESPLITFFMMTVNTICWGMVNPANDAMLIDASKPEQRKLMYSIVYWSFNLAVAIGGILGGFFFEKYMFELLIGLTCGSLLSVILVVFFIKETYFVDKKVSAGSHVRTMIHTYKTVLSDRLFILFVLAGTFLYSMEVQLINYIGIRLSDELPRQQFLFWDINGVQALGFLRTVSTILVVTLSILMVKMVKKIDDQWVLLFGSLIFALGYGMISYVLNIWILLILIIVATIGEMLQIPIQQSYLASIPPERLRSSYMAVSGLILNGGMLIASLTITISAFLPPLATTVVITGIGLGGVFIHFTIFRRVQRRARDHDLVAEEELQLEG
ncbi:MFS transporter, DHA1 family, multidrug resistance protein B [Marininema mesophilum]|uniref:MFS transporter, DHA1 family, multidrug resistance protein B n=1 Tax=Marininema mesophilum TaxID=1048340 RepID=A0A1H2W4I3_9BACL|nr:MFS transporter [Marininema mesophilum]SDW74989.1 MFS transporter, DHA1 family, multidrug resistance protein B [Marininema mesophilum]